MCSRQIVRPIFRKRECSFFRGECAITAEHPFLDLDAIVICLNNTERPSVWRAKDAEAVFKVANTKTVAVHVGPPGAVWRLDSTTVRNGHRATV